MSSRSRKFRGRGISKTTAAQPAESSWLEDFPLLKAILSSIGEPADKTAEIWRAHDVREKFFCEHTTGLEGYPPTVLPKDFPKCGNRSFCDTPSFRALKDLAAPGNGHTCLSTEQEYIANVW